MGGLALGLMMLCKSVLPTVCCCKEACACHDIATALRPKRIPLHLWE